MVDIGREDADGHWCFGFTFGPRSESLPEIPVELDGIPVRVVRGDYQPRRLDASRTPAVSLGYFQRDVTTMTEPPQRSDTGLRRRFAELSLEKKLSIFFVPVFVAVVGTLVPRFLGGGDDQPREENLEVVDLEAHNSTSYRISAEVRVLVRNTGHRRLADPLGRRPRRRVRRGRALRPARRSSSR